MSNFAMGTILGKGFAQAQVLWCMHECLCKTLSQDCPHGEVAFSNSDINKKTCKIKICQIASFMSTMCKWNLMISFTHSGQDLLCVNDTLWFHLHIVDLSTMCKWYLMISFTHSRLYKDIGSKAFFTMVTLLMPLLENGLSQVKRNFFQPRVENIKIVYALLGMPKCLVINLMLSTVIFLIIASS